MDCFEQSKKMVKISLTQNQSEELGLVLSEAITVLSEIEQNEDDKIVFKILKQIATKLSKAEAKL